MNKKTKTIIWVIVAVVLVAVLGILFAEIISPRYTELTFTEFYEKVAAGEINQVYADGYNLKGVLIDASGKGMAYYSTVGPNPYDAANPIIQEWIAKGVDIIYKDPNAGSIWSSVITMLGIVLVAVIFWLIMRQAAGGGKVMNVGKTKAHVQSNLKVRFADVAGAEEEKEELQEVVEFLKMPKKFSDLGARIPRGVLPVSYTHLTLPTKVLV